MIHLLTDGVYAQHVGYYMVDDLMWRQHAWTVNTKTGKIVDLPGRPPARRYYGFLKNPLEGYSAEECAACEAGLAPMKAVMRQIAAKKQ